MRTISDLLSSSGLNKCGLHLQSWITGAAGKMALGLASGPWPAIRTCDLGISSAPLDASLPKEKDKTRKKPPTAGWLNISETRDLTSTVASRCNRRGLIPAIHCGET